MHRRDDDVDGLDADERDDDAADAVNPKVAAQERAGADRLSKAARVKLAEDARADLNEIRNLAVGKPAPQIANGDEQTYPTSIANFTKGFPHNSFGEVDPSVYAAYLAAVKTGKRQDFDALTMGGTERLVDPQSGIAED